MRIGVLTSSRADYGIYLPLLQKMKNDSFFELEIIAFGTHLSKNHGFTLKNIESDGYNKIYTISSLISNDDDVSISTSYGLTVLKFADFWKNHPFDLVFCLGDRFEMNAAVQAGIPFGVKYAHIHGGEITLGAIDNIYRHQISLASKLHFTSTLSYKEKVAELIGTQEGVFDVGSLSLNNILDYNPIEKDLFFKEFNIPTEEFVLVTFHPETIAYNENIKYAYEMEMALLEIAKTIYVIITMPNADTEGSIYRDAILKIKTEMPDRFLLVENFGKEKYFAAMYYSKILIGNTSSGILEAASFGKYVVNVGNRQKGRVQSKNVLNCDFKQDEITSTYNKAYCIGEFIGENIYYKQNVANEVINTLKLFL